MLLLNGQVMCFVWVSGGKWKEQEWKKTGQPDRKILSDLTYNNNYNNN